MSPPWRRGWRGPSAEGRAPTAGSVATPSAFCPPPAALGPASSRHRQLQTSSGGGWREASGNQVPFPHDHPRGKQRGPLSRWTCSGLLLSCTRPPARAREQPPHRGLWWSVRTQTSHSPGEPPSAPTWTWLAPRSLHHDPGPDNSLLWAGVGVEEARQPSREATGLAASSGSGVTGSARGPPADTLLHQPWALAADGLG